MAETVVATLIFAIAMAVATSVFAFGTRVFSRETSAANLQQSLAAAKNFVLDDLSIAGYRPDALLAHASGAFAVLPPEDVFDDVVFDADFDRIDFRGDVESDGTTDRLCYRVLDNVLLRAVTTVGTSCATIWSVAGDGEEEALLAGVQTFELTFLSSARSALSETDIEDGDPRVRYVQVTLSVLGSVKGGAIHRTSRGEAAVRN